MVDIKEEKARIREIIWRLLEEKGMAAFPRPVYGRIPNFVGADRAASRLLSLPEWTRARVIKSNPDSPQYYVRLAALEQGKMLIMATPRLLNGFLVLDPRAIPRDKFREAATIRGAFKYGKPARLCDLPPVDLIIAGSVAVDLRGGRVGKGGGYSELEYAILRELGLVDENTPIATTVHDLQIVERVPLEEHDFTVDYIATPTKLMKAIGERKRPRGIIWEILGDRSSLPVIQELRLYKKK